MRQAYQPEESGPRRSARHTRLFGRSDTLEDALERLEGSERPRRRGATRCARGREEREAVEVQSDGRE